MFGVGVATPPLGRGCPRCMPPPPGGWLSPPSCCCVAMRSSPMRVPCPWCWQTPHPCVCTGTRPPMAGRCCADLRDAPQSGGTTGDAPPGRGLGLASLYGGALGIPGAGYLGCTSYGGGVSWCAKASRPGRSPPQGGLLQQGGSPRADPVVVHPVLQCLGGFETSPTAQINLQLFQGYRPRVDLLQAYAASSLACKLSTSRRPLTSTLSPPYSVTIHHSCENEAIPIEV